MELLIALPLAGSGLIVFLFIVWRKHEERKGGRR